jgi:methyltransferase (TIGR00027 family)
VIRNISDTALWAAIYRARESERKDALFRDPFARRLAGERGEEIAKDMLVPERHTWSFIVRTHLIDQVVAAEVRRGVDMVVNLAAGLDARPYRLELPASLRWVEVDLPDLIAYKQGLLAGERPTCALERFPVDLADAAARGRLFEDLGRRAKDALVLSEGLLVYLTADEVGALARDLAAPGTFRRWAHDLMSPGLLRMLQKRIGGKLAAGGAPLKFGPEEGPAFFEAHGWRPLEVHSMFKAAARLKRLPFLLRLLAMLPESAGPQGSRPWSGVCLLERR